MKAAPPSSPPAPPTTAGPPAQPLRLAHAGESLVIADIRGGPGLRQHLADMSLGMGAKLIIETGGRNGPMVVRAHGARLVLGRGMVERIYVRPAPAGGPGRSTL